jgi:hypothetical protein
MNADDFLNHRERRDHGERFKFDHEAHEVEQWYTNGQTALRGSLSDLQNAFTKPWDPCVPWSGTRAKKTLGITTLTF